MNRIAIRTYARHALGVRLEPTWDAQIEIGILFWRHQFTKAMNHPDISKGRQIFYSLLTETDDAYEVERISRSSPEGTWHRPSGRQSEYTLLYLHGGGYTFKGPVSSRFADMLAHHLRSDLFAPDYRLTPEHPHPAQTEDALTAWHFIAQSVPPERIVVIGDSAGGHMALMLLQLLKKAGLQQPALCVGLCPWTDIGGRGESLLGNDRYDLVQGWMALRFGKWLDPDGQYGRNALSPITHDFSGLAPLYLQAGGREVLRDMIREFAEVQAENGAAVILDLWEDMPHNFQAYDSLKSSSTHALQRLRDIIDSLGPEGPQVAPDKRATVVASGALLADQFRQR